MEEEDRNSSRFCNNVPQHYVCQDTFYLSRNLNQCAGYFSNSHISGNFCKPDYDTFLCWAPASPETTVAQLCPVVSTIGNRVLWPTKNIDAFATHSCNENSTWTGINYDLCGKYRSELIFQPASQIALHYITAIGSFLSLVTLCISLFIFFYFKSLYCCRLRAHRNFCVALIFNLLSLLTYNLVHTYHPKLLEVEWLCKSKLPLHMYFSMSSINWMFVEGLLLHSRVTTHIFRTEAPFKLYYLIGWGLPTLFVAQWTVLMFIYEPSECWNNYMNTDLYYIIAIPILTALLINAAFLVNIVRILIRKRRVENNDDETNKVRRAIKATVLLFPLLGIPYLAFSVRPEDNHLVEEIFMIANGFLISTQGLFFSILYCFLNDEVQTAVRNAYNRSTANSRLQFSRTRGMSQTSQTYLSDSVVTNASGQRINRAVNIGRQNSTPGSCIVGTTVTLNPMNNESNPSKSKRRDTAAL